MTRRIGLILGQDVEREMPGTCDRLPRLRRAIHADQHHRRLNRQGRHCTRRRAVTRPVQDRRHDSHAACEVAHNLAKLIGTQARPLCVHERKTTPTSRRRRTTNIERLHAAPGWLPFRPRAPKRRPHGVQYGVQCELICPHLSVEADGSNVGRSLDPSGPPASAPTEIDRLGHPTGSARPDVPPRFAIAERPSAGMGSASTTDGCKVSS